ncbi:drug/metabolite transporter (DMT)-like permease [Salirhabdus euzebyi]|uniref:Drug/metabolite transporter (DMT)-like permease n=1 Tax=Salirhabdus euzebyi TaxID=394506 RepID=A0A841Q6R0_9BACI|nr:DMT family transporter [Salirhabdus euzebyi]MBB6454065.1 drug/metabolite transporter (DMT)-like permease [Salirhabdus euzebyi]
MDNPKQHIKLYLLMLLVPMFWGAAFGAAKHVLTEIPPILAATIRFGLAGFILLVIVLVRKQWKFNVLRRRWLGLLLMSITGIFGYNALFFTALNYTSAINGSLIMATSPVFITIGAVLLFQEDWNRRVGIGLVLSFVGVLVVILKGSFHTLVTLSFNIGDLMFLGGLLCWVAHGLLGKVVMKGVSPLFTTTITTLTGTFFLFIWSIFEGGWSEVVNMSMQSWGEMTFMVIFSTVIAFLLWNTGIHQIGASKAGIYMNLVPINATWIALVFYDSSITWQQIIGMCMVIVGVYFTTVMNKKRKTNLEDVEWKQKAI